MGHLEVKLINVERVPLSSKKIAWTEVAMGLSVGVGRVRKKTAGRVFIQNKKTTADFECTCRLPVRLSDIDDIDDARLVLRLMCIPKRGDAGAAAPTAGAGAKTASDPFTKYTVAARVLPFMHLRENGHRLKRFLEPMPESGNAYGDSDADDDLLFGMLDAPPTSPCLRLSLSWFPRLEHREIRRRLNAHLYHIEFHRFLMRDKQWQTGYQKGKPSSLVERHPPAFVDVRKKAVLEKVAEDPTRYTGHVWWARWRDFRLPMRMGHVHEDGFHDPCGPGPFKWKEGGTKVVVTPDMLQYAAKNNDGGRGFPENKPEPRVKASPIALTSAILRAVFVQVDANNDGDLSKSEWLYAVTKNDNVRKLLNNEGVPRALRNLLQPKRYRRALMLMDTNKDGVISLDELLAFGTTLAKQEEQRKKKEARDRAEARSSVRTPGTEEAAAAAAAPADEGKVGADTAHRRKQAAKTKAELDEKRRMEAEEEEEEDDEDEESKAEAGNTDDEVEPGVYQWLHETDPQFVRYAEVFMSYGVAGDEHIVELTEDAIANMGVKKRDVGRLYGGVLRRQNELLPYHFYINFSKRNLFVDAHSSKLFQDELQVLEHPVLMSLRGSLLQLRDEAVAHAAGNGEWGANQDPLLTPICKEPCTIMGVERHVAFDISASGLYDEHGLWGNAFARASNMSVLAACHRLEEPSISHLLTVVPIVKNPTQALWHREKKPPPNDLRGRYTREQIVEMLTQFYTSFRSARLTSERRNYGIKGDQKPLSHDLKVVVHTSLHGCSELAGHNILMVAIVQMIAASTAGVDELRFHAVSPAQEDMVREALALATEFTAPVAARALSESEAKVAAINGVNHALLAEMREGGRATWKVVESIFARNFMWQHKTTTTQWTAFGAMRR